MLFCGISCLVYQSDNVVFFPEFSQITKDRRSKNKHFQLKTFGTKFCHTALFSIRCFSYGIIPVLDKLETVIRQILDRYRVPKQFLKNSSNF